MSKKYQSKKVEKRLLEIQTIHNELKANKNVLEHSRLSLIAYIMWQYPETRNNDITLALQFYKIFYPKFIKNGVIKIKDFYKIPKMYDIQRSRAEIQNDEGLFPAKYTVIKNRIKKELEYRSYNQNQNINPLLNAPEYFLYMDESGKTDKYFILAGVLINGIVNNDAFYTHINEIKENLTKKYNINISELKFANIKKQNLNYYKELILQILNLNVRILFFSLIVDNSSLKQQSRKNKTKELLDIALLDNLSSLIVHSTCSSPYGSIKAELNILLDQDGDGYDSIENEKIKLELKNILNKKYKYFINLKSFASVDSKKSIFIQLADLYASSLNNFYSKNSANSETAKCKKEFADLFVNLVGLNSLNLERENEKSKIKFLNKYISNYNTIALNN